MDITMARAAGRQARCPWCQRVFVVCGGCDHGHVYCCKDHVRAARLVWRRRSNAKHQATEEGRLDHRDRNRAYRCRRRAERARVTGPPAEKLTFADNVVAAESAPAVTEATVSISAGEPTDEHLDDRTAVARDGPNTTFDDAGPERHLQGIAAGAAGCASEGDGHSARRAVALRGRATRRCAVCGRPVDFFVGAGPARRPRLRREQRLLRRRGRRPRDEA